MLERRARELELVMDRYGELERAPDLSWFVVSHFPVPSGWNTESTRLLILLPPGYPQTPPDNFYTDVELRLADESDPGAATGTISHADCQWRQFSWHFEDAAEWQPHVEVEKGHMLVTFLLGIEQRLEEAS